MQSTINNARDRSWVRYLSEPSGWGRKTALATRHGMYLFVMRHLEDIHDFTNIALCKETKSLCRELGLDWRNCRCNCIS